MTLTHLSLVVRMKTNPYLDRLSSYTIFGIVCISMHA